MKKIIFLLITLVNANFIYACESPGIDWENIYHQMNLSTSDFDKNEYIGYEDFKKISNFGSYGWPKEKKYQSYEGKLNLFNDLDENKDNKLSKDELFRVYIFFPNPCEGWPWNYSNR